MARSAPVPSTVLVTGGAGFLGSHTCVELLDHGYEVIVVDNYAGSTPQVLTRVERVAGRFVGAVYELDVRDRRALSAVFDRHSVDAVVHFAGLKSAGESTRTPVSYYDTNLGGTTSLLRTMREHGVHRLVFTSTCAVYGDAGAGPLDEATPVRPGSPHATSAWLCEQVLADVCRHWPALAVLCLRTSNVAGAHPSGLLGESPRGTPENLLPTLARVAGGRQARLRVYGADHPTRDGTAVRDYLHVMDAAEAHRVALDHLTDTPGLRLYNLGTGRGSSVREMISEFAHASDRPLPHEPAPRRPSDPPQLIADPTAVSRAWTWHPHRTTTDICHDTWHFHQLNPHGYADSARRT